MHLPSEVEDDINLLCALLMSEEVSVEVLLVKLNETCEQALENWQHYGGYGSEEEKKDDHGGGGPDWKVIISNVVREQLSVQKGSALLREFKWKCSADCLENPLSTENGFFSRLLHDRKERAIALAKRAAKIWDSIKSSSTERDGEMKANSSASSVWASATGASANVANASATAAASSVSATATGASANVANASATGASSSISATVEGASANLANISATGASVSASVNVHGPRINAGNISLQGPSVGAHVDLGPGVSVANLSVAAPSCSVSISTDVAIGNVGIGGGVGINLNPLSLFNLGFGGGGGGGARSSGTSGNGSGQPRAESIPAQHGTAAGPGTGAGDTTGANRPTRMEKLQAKFPNRHYNYLTKEKHINDVFTRRNADDQHRESAEPRSVGYRSVKEFEQGIHEIRPAQISAYPVRRDQGIYTGGDRATAEGYASDKVADHNARGEQPAKMVELGAAPGVPVFASDGSWSMDNADQRGNHIRDMLRQQYPRSVVGGPQGQAPDMQVHEYIISPEAARVGGKHVVTKREEVIGVKDGKCIYQRDTTQFTEDSQHTPVIPTHFAGMEQAGYVNPAAAPQAVNPRVAHHRTQNAFVETRKTPEAEAEEADVMLLIQEMAQAEGIAFTAGLREAAVGLVSDNTSSLSSDAYDPEDVEEDAKSDTLLCSHCKVLGKPQCLPCLCGGSRKKLIRVGNICGFAP